MKYKVLFVDDDSMVLVTMKSRYVKRGYLVETAETGEDAVAKVKADPNGFAAAVVDFKLAPGLTGTATIRSLKKICPELTVICFSGYGNDPQAIKASWNAGALEFIEKGEGDELEKLDRVLENACRKFEETTRILSTERDPSENEALIQSVGMVGASDELAAVARKIHLYRNHQKNVLILGETGTGKRHVAEALHSGDRETFFEVNCADYSEDPELLRSELFGYEQGAFTGANKPTRGIFENANRGTVFLDEIHELSSAAQAQIYMVVEEHRIKRVGGSSYYPVDVRIIAAAKTDLEGRVRDGKFRADLFERLNVLTLMVPPLRDRVSDIEPLVRFFCEKYAEERGVEKTFLMRTVRQLESYDWPRNVRELKNAVERLLYTTKNGKVAPVHLESKFFKDSSRKRIPPYKEFRYRQDREFRKYLLDAYRRNNFNSAKTAEFLHVAPNTLRCALKKFGLYQGTTDKHSPSSQVSTQ